MVEAGMTNLMNLVRRSGSAAMTAIGMRWRRSSSAAMTAIVDVSRRFTWMLAALALVVAMGGTWMTSATATAAPGDSLAPRPTTTPATKTGTTDRAAGGTATVASQSFQPGGDEEPAARKKPVAGRLNLNTATEEQLMLLPQVGPAKAERIVTWRRKNGGFKRTADLRRVKGFGYKTYKRLEPLLDIRGETTLAPK